MCDQEGLVKNISFLSLVYDPYLNGPSLHQIVV